MANGLDYDPQWTLDVRTSNWHNGGDWVFYYEPRRRRLAFSRFPGATTTDGNVKSTRPRGARPFPVL